jgi:glutamate-1-semialdehyde 2,1-aminomutase
MVTYGKTLGGGLPVGVVCGKRELMRRYRDDRPADICFARGTFNSHPYVMAAMAEFLRAHRHAGMQCALHGSRHDGMRAPGALNARLAGHALPLRVAKLSTVWTVLYTRPSRYNWMLQYYLRAEGLALSWVGTGRFIFSLNYTEADFRRGGRAHRGRGAAMERMAGGGVTGGSPTRAIRRRILKEMLVHRFLK